MIDDKFYTNTQEREAIDWKRAENLVKTGGREEVEVISSSTRGFVVCALLLYFTILC